jgi:hypothetical protein
VVLEEMRPPALRDVSKISSRGCIDEMHTTRDWKSTREMQQRT